MKYPLTNHEFDDQDLNNIIELFQSRSLTMGKCVGRFEREVSDFHSKKYGAMVNSGSSANLVLIAALMSSGRLAVGDKVLVPAVSWSTTFFPLVQYGLIPVFVDVELDTWTIDPAICLKAATEDPRIRAVLFVSLLGSFRNYREITELCEALSLILLVDNCEGFGSRCSNGKIGTICGAESLGMTLSFFYSHQLPAIEGGMILTDDEELYHHMLSLRAHGWTRDLPNGKYLEIDSNDFTRLFRFVLPGYCVRPMEINAVLGIERLRRWDETFSIRSQNHGKYIELFSNNTRLSIQSGHDGQSAFGFGMLLPSTERRQTLIELCQAAEIQCRPVVAGNFLNNPVCKRIKFETHGDFYCADLIDNCGVFFGNTNRTLNDQLELLYSVVDSCFE